MHRALCALHRSLAACRTVYSPSVCAGTICISASQHPVGITQQEEEAFLILVLIFPQLYLHPYPATQAEEA